MLQHLGIALITLIIAFAPHAKAQEDLEAPFEGAAESSEKQVEELYDKDEAKTATQSAPKPREEHKEIKDVHTLTDLANLAPFTDIAVIQRRFLPKSQRFEASIGAFTNLNNPFFNAIGVSGRLAYYLKEKWAIEGIVSMASTTTRQVTDDLEQKEGITTDNVVTSKGFGALAIKWNPIYGKITWLNKTIVPFDLNFNLGAGMTQTTSGQNCPTLHFGTSQVFAWSKSMAFRWDLIWNMFRADAKDENNKNITLLQNDLFLGLGVSFYFPEATYR